MGIYSLNWDGIEKSGPEFEYLAGEMQDRGKSVEQIAEAMEELDRGATPEEILDRLEAEDREEAEAERQAQMAAYHAVQIVRGAGITDPDEIAEIIEGVVDCVTAQEA